MDSIVHGVAKTGTQLGDFHFTSLRLRMSLRVQLTSTPALTVLDDAPGAASHAMSFA